MTRCFIALNFTPKVISGIESFSDLLKKQNLIEAKYTSDENLHLTLKFLGDVKDLDKVKDALKTVKFNAFDSKLAKAGTFGKTFIRIIWLDLESKELFDLQKEVDKSLKGQFECETQFSSHVTVARLKAVRDRTRLVEFIETYNKKTKPVEFKVDSFFLMKSTLGPSGPKYSIIEEYKLN